MKAPPAQHVQSPSQRALLRPPPRVWWLTVGAVLLYGAIAAWANRLHGEGVMLRSALVQGLSCGVTTFSLSTLIDRGFVWLLHRRYPPRASAASIALTAVALGTGLHVAVNIWAGTPELAATVVWPALALSVYCPLYAAAALKRMP
jgi:hypothetical protein